MEPETIKYIPLGSEKEVEYVLSNQNPAENLTKLECTFDKTPLIFAYDGHGGKGIYCIKCDAVYGNLGFNAATQEDINEEAVEIAKKWEREFRADPKVNLLRKIKLAENERILQSII